MYDSDDYSTDDKRKRAAQDMVFNRSKKINRTPEIGSKSEEKLDLLINMIRELKDEVKSIRTEQEECRQEVTKIREENKQIMLENQNLQTENKVMKTKMNEMSDRIEWLEQEKRKNNVVMSGLKINMDDRKILQKTVENILSKDLQIQVKVTSTRKIGGKICLIELENEEAKELVMKNKNKLKYSKDEKIYINQDMTKEEREKAKIIRRVAQQEKDKGKNVKIGYNKLNIDGEEWRWNKRTARLEPTSSKN